jgi:hypothetical protein
MDSGEPGDATKGTEKYSVIPSSSKRDNSFVKRNFKNQLNPA